MKIIDLLNKIANGEEVPKKIKWGVHEFEWVIYEYRAKGEFQEPILLEYLSQAPSMLNDEVEIIEEEKKIPEKLKWNEKSQHNVVTDNTKKTLEHLLSRSEQLKKSINQIVDYLDYLKSKGEKR